MRRKILLPVLSAAAVLALAVTSVGIDEPRAEAATPAANYEPVGEGRVIASGLDLPWSIVRLPTGSTLISERDTAQVKELMADGTVRVIRTVPGVVPNGEGGLLGLAVRSTSLTWLYAYTSTATDNRVVRMRLRGEPGSYTLGWPQVVLKGIPNGRIHNGGRIKFGPDGKLYITAGDTGNTKLAQNKRSLGGKILRINSNGSVPSDNPFRGSPIWSLGHRNPQGITWSPTGAMWSSELGQNTWDELNRIKKGKNYGWPIVEGKGSRPGFADPRYQWATSEASPSGLLWSRNTLFMAAMRGERLWVIYQKGDSKTLLTRSWNVGDPGRIRDVVKGPNGTIWIVTSNTGRNERTGDDKILELSLEPIG